MPNYSEWTVDQLEMERRSTLMRLEREKKELDLIDRVLDTKRASNNGNGTHVQGEASAQTQR